MQILNIAGYKFVTLTNVESLQQSLLSQCQKSNLKGTILLSTEGININLSGLEVDINNFINILLKFSEFSDMTFRRSFSQSPTYKRLKVKIKPEIITMRQKDIFPEKKTANHLPPHELKKWLDENRDITLLDTRNDYEVRFGSFNNALNLKMNDFSEFPQVASALDRSKTIVMFCTGGIRCEKASSHLLNEGFQNVFQLEGGILNYFSQVGSSHFKGECFVFDDRIAINPDLKETGTKQCLKCYGPIQKNSKSHCQH